MGYKIKHYAQPVKLNPTVFFEVILIEFSVGLICAGMAYWARDVEIRLFIGCLVVALMCFALTIYNIYVIVQLKREARQKELDEGEKD